MDSARILLAALAFIVLSPVLIPAALVAHTLYERRKRAAADAFRCAACGAVLGQASLHLADEEWSAHVRELLRQGGKKLRRVRTVHAICAGCGQRYTYLEEEHRFVPEAA